MDECPFILPNVVYEELMEAGRILLQLPPDLRKKELAHIQALVAMYRERKAVTAMTLQAMSTGTGGATYPLELGGAYHLLGDEPRCRPKGRPSPLWERREHRAEHPVTATFYRLEKNE